MHISCGSNMSVPAVPFFCDGMIALYVTCRTRSDTKNEEEEHSIFFGVRLVFNSSYSLSIHFKWIHIISLANTEEKGR